MQNRAIYPVLALFLLLFLIFPNANPGADSLYYAACVRHGENLFLNHHLLYNAFGRIMFTSLNMVTGNQNALHLLMAINAVFAAGSLFLFYRLILNLQEDSKVALLITAFCASCFGFMRFATDAETYIIPLFFNILSAFYIRLSGNRFKWLLAGTAGALAVLFHEIHIWWAASVFVYLLSEGKKQIRNFLEFSFPFLAIPMFYLWVYSNSGFHGDFQGFISGAYGKGQAGIDLSMQALYLTAVNGIRTVIQIHGYIPFLIRQWPVTAATTLLILIAAGVAALHFRAYSIRLIRIQKATGLARIAAMAFFLYLGFACISSGNAEFMVMLPFLATLWLASARFIKTGMQTIIPIGMILLWNVITGILPAAKTEMENGIPQANFQEQNPEAYFIWKDRPQVHNRIAYRYGTWIYGKLQDQTVSMELMDKALLKNIPVYTDYGNNTTKYSRKSMTGKGQGNIPDRYRLFAVDSFLNIYGTNYIFRILPDK